MIRVKRASKHYEKLTAVDDVTFSVGREQIMVLLGSSGCGKTTTLRLIAGLERPDGGEIWLDGQPVASQSAWIAPEQRHIGMVFQDYALFPHLTVQQNIEFALKGMNGRKKSARVGDMLDLVGLTGMEKRYPHQMSGGQQQRVALARALAPEPSVVLLDEPFSNLDAALRKFMRGEVRRILEQARATTIFVTHDQEEAMSLADEIAVMQGGKLLQVGKPRDLYRFPTVRDVAEFLGEVNWLPGDASGDSVETALGTLPLVHPAQGYVDVMIRPEALQVQADPDGGGRITDVQFFGYYQLLTVALPDDTLLQVRVWAQSDFPVGQSVRLQVEGDVVAFRTVETTETASH